MVMTGYWYIVQVYTGHEKKIQSNLERRLASKSDSDREIRDEILGVNVPMSTTVKNEDGKRKVRTAPTYPGYVLINVQHQVGPHADSEIGRKSWAFVQETPGVMNFLGNANPIPLSEEDVERMLATATVEEEAPVPEITFSIGDKVRVIEGPFSSFTAEILGIDTQRQRLSLSITIFGRSTPLELGFMGVERL
ncbi:transcription termination/antitermination factor NusG [Candidatus Poribacteria bacterium]|nr:transcription termination/antitermination factor NusG [Candidatus Poribacteria bacterium]